MVIRNHIFYSIPFRASYGYLFLALMLLVMSWEGLRNDAAVAAKVIPEESIRLRILANSDSPADQAVKLHIRDAIIAELENDAGGRQLTIEAARLTITGRLPDFERLIRRELAARGFDYGVKAELGIVPFPTKMYGNRVYPAGDYEALRITLGEGKGQNWWCVLFPPLCFVDSVSGDATGVKTAAATAATADTDGETGPKREAPEMKFFVWELLQSMAEFIKNLFR
ncbi:stage II sporulation protein R [Paenibacillus darwinianus]|uniref:Stage II sporulation protein R n=1 Tax=Paenibacillus darwinianus TaxID=1380763 RepID=A0A9W5W6Q8_9BACL|nr:stage II sporulation protein R [Paenibacillus darwinianus]EXX84562.1 stage II sporulation protein R [Paenibacillus darwinianus]EXX87387.1 stage II sporulation protein R [Paenibacillus darwinianus]EXX87390.1 stage II sporulation protein R [Paenibacillus darwinianus]